MKTQGKRCDWSGLSRFPEYKVWFTMLDRCTNASSAKWERYGGRGIVVCERWINSFECFLIDMGRRPSNNHSIDRIDNDGNYEPSNCRWATRLSQMNNRAANVFLTLNGITRTKSQWARCLGLRRCSIDNRLRRGWSLQRALTEGKNHK